MLPQRTRGFARPQACQRTPWPATAAPPSGSLWLRPGGWVGDPPVQPAIVSTASAAAANRPLRFLTAPPAAFMAKIRSTFFRLARLSELHGLLDQPLDDLRLRHRRDHLPANEYLALSVPGCHPQVG